MLWISKHLLISSSRRPGTQWPECAESTAKHPVSGVWPGHGRGGRYDQSVLNAVFPAKTHYQPTSTSQTMVKLLSHGASLHHPELWLAFCAVLQHCHCLIWYQDEGLNDELLWIITLYGFACVIWVIKNIFHYSLFKGEHRPFISFPFLFSTFFGFYKAL